MGPGPIVAGVGVAVDDQTQDAVLAPKALEGEDLFVYPAGLRRVWRADDDLAGGPLQGLADDRAQIGRGGEFFAVPEDRRQALGHRAVYGRPANQLLRRVVGLERPVQPAPPLGVTVAVAEKRPIPMGVQAGDSSSTTASLADGSFVDRVQSHPPARKTPHPAPPCSHRSPLKIP